MGIIPRQNTVSLGYASLCAVVVLIGLEGEILFACVARGVRVDIPERSISAYLFLLAGEILQSHCLKTKIGVEGVTLCLRQLRQMQSASRNCPRNAHILTLKLPSIRVLHNIAGFSQGCSKESSQGRVQVGAIGLQVPTVCFPYAEHYCRNIRIHDLCALILNVERFGPSVEDIFKINKSTSMGFSKPYS